MSASWNNDAIMKIIIGNEYSENRFQMGEACWSMLKLCNSVKNRERERENSRQFMWLHCTYIHRSKQLFHYIIKTKLG